VINTDCFERGNTIKTEINFKADGTLTDPSGNAAFVTVIKSDGTTLINASGASRDGTGEYHYYFNTSTDDPLGIYVIQWSGYHSLGGSYGYKPIIQRDLIHIVDTQD
jgi:hypothetical protein